MPEDPSVGILMVALKTGFPTLGGNGKSMEVSQAEKENSESALKLVPYIKIVQRLSLISNVGNRQKRANHFFDDL